MAKTFIKNKLSDDNCQNFVIVVPTRALLSEIANGLIIDLKSSVALERITTTMIGVAHSLSRGGVPIRCIVGAIPCREVYRANNSPGCIVLSKIFSTFATHIRSIAATVRWGRKVRATQSATQVNGLMFVRA